MSAAMRRCRFPRDRPVMSRGVGSSERPLFQPCSGIRSGVQVVGKVAVGIDQCFSVGKFLGFVCDALVSFQLRAASSPPLFTLAWLPPLDREESEQQLNWTCPRLSLGSVIMVRSRSTVVLSRRIHPRSRLCRSCGSVSTARRAPYIRYEQASALVIWTLI